MENWFRYNTHPKKAIYKSVSKRVDRLTALENIKARDLILEEEFFIAANLFSEEYWVKKCASYWQDIPEKDRIVLETLPVEENLYPYGEHVMSAFKTKYNATSEQIMSIWNNPWQKLDIYLSYNSFMDLDNKSKVFLLASKINHSCEPNCNYFIFNGVITVICRKNILIGEELTIDYSSVQGNVEERRVKLYKDCLFVCKCPKCLSEEACKVCKARIGLKCCTRCKVVNYCSIGCQKDDWPKHKLTCGK